MHRKAWGCFGVGALVIVVSCGGSERSFESGGNGGMSSTSTNAGGGNGGRTSGGGGSGVSTVSTGGKSGASGMGGAQAGSGGSSVDASATDTGTDSGPKPDVSQDTGSTDASTADASADGPRDAPPDVPKSCKGPPTCGAAVSQVSCTGIRGCSWSQCAFKTPGVGVACGAEGLDRANNCPPGCHFMTNCVGANNDYYGSPDSCGAATRQTQNACVGVGSVWQMCIWLPAVTCVGQPVRTDCTGIMDPIICAQEGCSWQ